jgi:hypothetical protein
MYYSDSRFVCNAPHCEVRTRVNPLLRFQTVVKGEIVILGFHQDCGLPSNAKKCCMPSCNVYLDSMYLSKINRKNIGYCSSHNHKIASLWESFYELSDENKVKYEEQFYKELECAYHDKELEDDDYYLNAKFENESEYTNINFDTFRDELTNNLRGLNDPLLNHLDEYMQRAREKEARDEAVLKAHQHAEDLRRGIKRK